MVYVEKIKERIVSVFRQGLSSHELAICITIAVLATTFPVFGLTTIVVTAIAVKKRLNLPFLVLVTYSLEPLRFLAFIPLTKFGSFVMNNSNNTLTIEMVKQVFSFDFMEIITFFFSQLIYALLGWTLIILPLAVPFFYVTKSIIGFSLPKTKKCLD